MQRDRKDFDTLKMFYFTVYKDFGTFPPTLQC